jgi:hypothetical protein
MRISNYLKIAKYLDGFIGVPRRENPPSYESAQYVGDLDIEKMRSVDRFPADSRPDA